MGQEYRPCHITYVEVRGQPVRVSSLLPHVGLRTELGLPGLAASAFACWAQQVSALRPRVFCVLALKFLCV